jgi:hypothetical protein
MMPKSRPPYASDLRHPVIELVSTGRRPDELARELDLPAQMIRNWVAHSTKGMRVYAATASRWPDARSGAGSGRRRRRPRAGLFNRWAESAPAAS